MNKQEILNEINKTKQHLTNMEKMLQECECERWKPKANEKYWYIDSSGSVNYTLFMSEMEIDAIRFKNYNCFGTLQEAEVEVEKILVRRMLEDIARRLNKGQKIDWNNFDQNKYFISFNCATQLIERDFYNLKNKVQGVVYCLSDDFANAAIQEIGEERLKKYLRGE